MPPEWGGPCHSLWGHNWIKPTVLCAVGFSALFSLASLVFYFGDWDRLVFVALLGAFVGAVAAPEFEPKAFKYPVLVQSCSGAISGMLFGLAFSLSGEYIAVSSAAGIILGFTASFWVKHVPLP